MGLIAEWVSNAGIDVPDSAAGLKLQRPSKVTVAGDYIYVDRVRPQVLERRHKDSIARTDHNPVVSTAGCGEVGRLEQFEVCAVRPSSPPMLRTRPGALDLQHMQSVAAGGDNHVITNPVVGRVSVRLKRGFDLLPIGCARVPDQIVCVH